MRLYPLLATVTAVLFAAALLVAAPMALAQEPPPETAVAEPAKAETRIAEWDRTAAALEQALDAGEINVDGLERLRATVTDQRAAAKALAARLESEAAPIRAQLVALGPAPEGGAPEAADVATSRFEIQRRLAVVEGLKKQAELAAARASELETRLAGVSRTLLADKLLQREPSVFDWRVWLEAGVEAPKLAGKLAAGADAALRAVDPLGEDAIFFFAALAVIVFWLFCRSFVDRVIDRLIAGLRASRGAGVQILFGVAIALTRIGAPVISALVVIELIDAAGVLPPAGALLLRRCAEGVIIIALTTAVARSYFAPRLAEQRIIDLGDPGAGRATWRATLLAALAAAHYALIEPAAAAGAAPAFLTVANTLIVALAGPVMLTLFLTVCRRPPTPETAADSAGASPPAPADGEEEIDFAGGLLAVLRLVGSVAAIAMTLAAIVGLRELSQFLLYRVCLTIALAAVAGVVFIIVRRLRAGPDADGRVSLAPVMAAMLLALASAPALAVIWGASAADLRVLAGRLLEGVTIGESTFSLSDLLAALLVMSLGVWMTRLVQRLMRRTVLPSTRLDTGARDALLTGLGYVGFLITTLLAVSAAGLDLSNLALVAGALSVGIGFGLQNIVSNFVSGLILLIERPVKVGDWIVVGEAQGYVRKINVRSTEIETFDRASVIVPNSELISNQVLNWTHKNLTGRCIVTVGVGYDSDPDQVMTILREVATAHPMTLPYPQPFIVFAGFGDSALEFEARVYIRDVNWTISVKSDLNLEVLKRLREAGVEIPFPQRDLHIRSGLPAAREPETIAPTQLARRESNLPPADD